MLSELIQLVREARWKEARDKANELQKMGEKSDMFWAMNARICQAEGDRETMFACLVLGMEANIYNDQFYSLLGDYYCGVNDDQALLCYEQALFLCMDEEEKESVRIRMEKLEDCHVRPVSVVLAVEDEQWLNECRDCLRNSAPEDICHVTVSAEGSTLVEKYNRGLEKANPEGDVLFLNEMALLPDNALFWMRMALYEDGSTGCVFPQIQVLGEEHWGKWKRLLGMAASVNRLVVNPCERTLGLAVEKCMLLKRELVDKVLPWPEGTPVCMAAYKVSFGACEQGFFSVSCHNSLYYYLGQPDRDYYISEREVSEILAKYGGVPMYYAQVRTDLLRFIKNSPEEEIHVLEVGCGMGATLARVRYQWKNAKVYGIEVQESIARYAGFYADVASGDVEKMEIPCPEHSLDYILFGDVLEHLRDPEKLICRMKRYLKPQGRILACIPNVQNISVVIPLLRGRFTYQNSGLLDKTHIHLFTRYEIQQMFGRQGYEIEDLRGLFERESMTEEDLAWVEQLYSLPGIQDHQEFEIYQYLVVARVR